MDVAYNNETRALMLKGEQVRSAPALSHLTPSRRCAAVKREDGVLIMAARRGDVEAARGALNSGADRECLEVCPARRRHAPAAAC